MEDHHPHIKRIHWYLLVLTIAVFALIWVIYRSQTPQTTTQQQQAGQEEKIEKRGSLILKDKDNLRNYQVDRAITLQVVADSEGADVVGFDILLDYDKSAFTLTSAQTPLTGFRLFSKQNENHLSLTATQLLESKVRSLFSATAIVELVLVPKKAGSYTFSLLDEVGNESTKFVDTQSTRLYPQTVSLKVEVK